MPWGINTTNHWNTWVLQGAFSYTIGGHACHEICHVIICRNMSWLSLDIPCLSCKKKSCALEKWHPFIMGDVVRSNWSWVIKFCQSPHFVVYRLVIKRGNGKIPYDEWRCQSENHLSDIIHSLEKKLYGRYCFMTLLQVSWWFSVHVILLFWLAIDHSWPPHKCVTLHGFVGNNRVPLF